MSDQQNSLTKKDLIEALEASEARVRETLRADLDSSEGRLRETLRAELASLDERLREYVHDTETKLLTAFHKFATTNDTRLRTLETFQATGTQRLADLEAAGRLSLLELKVAEIEKKLDRRQ